MILLVLGANSDLAYAVSKEFAKREKAQCYLASRNMELLEKKANDLVSRYQVKATPVFFDAIDYDSHQKFYENLPHKPDGVVLAFGELGDQHKAENDFMTAKRIIETNFLGAVSVLDIIAADFERRGHGFIVGISSVAGERGRKSNYVYGSAKAALTAYLSGLRNRLSKRNVKVITVLPGFLKTKMTENMDLPEKLTAEPDEAAQTIYQAVKKGKNIIYIKGIWRLIMLIIRNIPEPIFKRLSL